MKNRLGKRGKLTENKEIKLMELIKEWNLVYKNPGVDKHGVPDSKVYMGFIDMNMTVYVGYKHGVYKSIWTVFHI